MFVKTSCLGLLALLSFSTASVKAFSSCTPFRPHTTISSALPMGLSFSSLEISTAALDESLDILKASSKSVIDAAVQSESPTEFFVQIQEPASLPVVGGAAVLAATVAPACRFVTTVVKSVAQLAKGDKKVSLTDSRGYRIYPEGQPATYEMNPNVIPFEFGEAAFVRPLLKQTQLETRPLKVVYDAKRDGYDYRKFHSMVDGKGAAVVLCKVAGQWCGGYNPRGWASLGSPRSSVAAFLFYQKNLLWGGWQKVRVSRTGSMACGNDLYDGGIQFGADSLVIPLRTPNTRKVTSRLGQYYEAGPGGRLTIMPRPSEDFRLQELKILTGVYAPGEGTWDLIFPLLALLFHLDRLSKPWWISLCIDSDISFFFNYHSEL